MPLAKNSASGHDKTIGALLFLFMPEYSPDTAGHRARLRERFLRVGLENMPDYEVLELLLTLGIPRRDVKPLAKHLIKTFGSLYQVLDASIERLQAVEGIGTVSPVIFRLIREASALYLRQELEPEAAEAASLDSVDKLSEFWRVRLGHLRHEVFEVAFFDRGFRLLSDGVERMEEGLTDRANVYPRKIMEASLRKKASHIVLAHNHPAGDPTPSQQDIAMTQAIVRAAKPLEISVIDHQIITPEKVFSFHRNGLMPS